MTFFYLFLRRFFLRVVSRSLLRSLPLSFCSLLLLSACSNEQNDPYPAQERGKNILYSAFTERPKHLDPVQSYAEEEILFTAQIYEPPLQYHYLKRPYVLIPATAQQVPVPRYYNALGEALNANADSAQIAYSEYEIKLKPGTLYQPHPAFAQDKNGQSLYLNLNQESLRGIEKISDFAETGTRELIADDYIYEIKRLAHPRLHSPIFATMSERIVGLQALSTQLRSAAQQLAPDAWLDLDRFPLEGVSKLDRYTLRIKLHGKYPQFLYWLAMPFFAPIPREADRFYSQPGMADKNLTLDWYPIGTGPYMLTENNPNSRMVLTRNPNFRAETYPCAGELDDQNQGYLADCGQTLPFIEQAVFTLEKESIPYWNKFLQGYYDASGISSDSFDQAVQMNVGGNIELSDEMQAKGIKLLSSVRPSIFYMGFNLLDAVVGAQNNPENAERARKLRQALSIAIDQEEFISIFLNGRGIAAMNPLPPGIFGRSEAQAGFNSVVYDWQDGRAQRKPIDAAKALLAEAGWPGGRDAKTGEALVLYLDTVGGGMGDKSRLDWLTRQFAKLNIQLVVRSTDFNRFQEKVRKGDVQIYFLGWNADYPDPENFFFLLLGSEGKVAKAGENASNYINPAFDRLFAEMKNMDNSPARAAIIQRMNLILQNDAPWIFAFHPKSYTLAHAWADNRKPTGGIINNSLKYQRIDVAARARARDQWNVPTLWPLLLGGLLLSALVGYAVLSYQKRLRQRVSNP